MIDILAIAAHRDDVEQTCGGTLLAMHFGFSALLFVGGVFCLIAALSVPRAPVIEPEEVG